MTQTTEWLDTLPVDETLERAKQIKFSRVLRTAFFGFFYIVFGWIPGRLWVVAVFIALAVAEGWEAGSQPARKPAEGTHARQ